MAIDIRTDCHKHEEYDAEGGATQGHKEESSHLWMGVEILHQGLHGIVDGGEAGTETTSRKGEGDLRLHYDRRCSSGNDGVMRAERTGGGKGDGSVCADITRSSGSCIDLDDMICGSDGIHSKGKREDLKKRRGFCRRGGGFGDFFVDFVYFWFGRRDGGDWTALVGLFKEVSAMSISRRQVIAKKR